MDYNEYLEKTKETIKDPQEELNKKVEALEIIKERKVDIYLLEITKNVDQYNRPFEDHLVSLCRLLTEEEYQFIKEVLL